MKSGAELIQEVEVNDKQADFIEGIFYGLTAEGTQGERSICLCHENTISKVDLSWYQVSLVRVFRNSRIQFQNRTRGFCSLEKTSGRLGKAMARTGQLGKLRFVS